ncbi:MAG: GNAT family N-acetyltransferase [Candidatus Spyradocola sp.]|jgi:predicted acetyltransferase
MEARKLQTAQEFLEAHKISTIAFVGTMDMEKAPAQIEEERKKNDGSTEYWGSFDEDGTMTSHLLNNIYHILYDGRIVLSGGIGNVSSLPEYRRKGGIREIFRAMFADMRARGFVFSALYPFSHEYYRKFGYEYGCGPLRQRFPVADLRAFPCPYQVRMHKPGECIQPFQDVYQRFILGLNMAIVRSEAQWDWIEGDPWKDRVYRYLLADETGTHAYVLLRAEGTGEERKAVLKDFAYDSREAFYGILGFLYRLSAQYTYVEAVFPPQIDMRTLLPEPYHVEQRVDTHGMFRVVDVPQALRLMRHPEATGRYTIGVKDAFLPENTGVYAVRFSQGSVSVERTDAPADLVVDVTTLAQLTLGFAPLDTLRYRPDVEIHGNLETLRAVFVKKDCYFADYF